METLTYNMSSVLSDKGVAKVVENVATELSAVVPQDIKLEVKDTLPAVTVDVTDPVDNGGKLVATKVTDVYQDAGIVDYNGSTDTQTFIKKYQTPLLLAGAGLVAYFLLFKK